MTGPGTVYSFTVIHPAPKTGQPPYALGYVDTARRSVRIFGRLLGKDRPAIGDRYRRAGRHLRLRIPRPPGLSGRFLRKTSIISGGAMTPFGRHPGVLAPELAQQAILKAVDDAGVDAAGHRGRLLRQRAWAAWSSGQLIVRDLGLRGIPVYNVENACASAATGVHLARHALLAQQYETVLVFGIEQLTALRRRHHPLQRNDYKAECYAERRHGAAAVCDARHAFSCTSATPRPRIWPPSPSRTAATGR